MVLFLLLSLAKTFMMLKRIIMPIIITTSCCASECSPYYNPEKFYDTPEYLSSLIDKNIEQKNLTLFGKASNYKKLQLEKKDTIYRDKYIKLNDYYYPMKNGIFEYSIQKNKIDEISIAQVELYKYGDIEIAEEINNNFEEFWSDWIENNYEMKLYPEQTLFKYKEKYFTFSVYIYGIKGDGTTLDTTRVKYWFKDYTKEVNEYMRCMSL